MDRHLRPAERGSGGPQPHGPALRHPSVVHLHDVQRELPSRQQLRLHRARHRVLGPTLYPVASRAQAPPRNAGDGALRLRDGQRRYRLPDAGLLHAAPCRLP